VNHFKDLVPPWGPCGYVTYKRTYARNTPAGVTEEWWQTIQRGCNGILDIGGIYTPEEISEFFYYWFSLKACPAGRPIWQLGTPTIDKVGGDSMQNCFSGDTEIRTYHGNQKFKNLVGQSISVQSMMLNGQAIWTTTTVKSFGVQKLMRVVFSNGTSVFATPSHEWVPYNFAKARVQTKDLNPGFKVPYDLKPYGAPDFLEVFSVEETNREEEVYCCEVSEYHNFTLANGVLTGNCWHVAVNHPIDPFIFTFNQLMLGGGVGFNILPEYVYEMPIVKFDCTINRVDTFDCDYIVTDNREGWVDLLRRVLESFFYTGKDIRYNTLCVRDKGRLINGFGGVASGPEELVRGIGLIAAILRNARGRKLRPTECMDIMNIIGSIVVAGNVRRSAEITIGSYEDPEYLSAKDWSIRQVPAYRQMSNNTVQTHDVILLPERFWRGYEGKGEPYGLFNLNLSRQYGRLVDGLNYRPDPYVIGPNPCAEIILESHEACNLGEMFLPNIVDVNEFGRAAELLFRAAKAIGSLKFWHPKTNEVVSRNNRIGLSVTGYLQDNPFIGNAEAFDAVYNHLEYTDKWLSREMRRNESVKLTTVKPSGTLSLLAGCTPGVHPAFSKFWIRRISFASNDPIVAKARELNYTVEPKWNIDGSRDLNTLVIDFPCRVPDNTACASDLSAIDQLNNQLFLQRHWADNSVSMTCYFKPDEVAEIRNWLGENYHDQVKTTSFLLHQDHGFKQAPYEEINEDQYNELISRCPPIMELSNDYEARDLIESVECGTGGCPTK